MPLETDSLLLCNGNAENIADLFVFSTVLQIFFTSILVQNDTVWTHFACYFMLQLEFIWNQTLRFSVFKLTLWLIKQNLSFW